MTDIANLPAKNRVWTLATPLDREVAFAMIEQVAFGKTLRELEHDADLPPMAVFMNWMVQNPEINQLWHKAREISSYALEDEAIHILRALRAEDGLTQNYLRAVNMLVEQLRWSADKRNSSVFGTRNQTSVVVPIQINTSLDLGEGTQVGRGTAEFPNIYEVTGSFPEAEPNPNPVLKSDEGVPANLFRAAKAKREAEAQAAALAKRQRNAERMRRVRASKKEKKNVRGDTPDSI